MAAKQIENVCEETFLDSASLNYNSSSFDPKEDMTPSNATDITKEDSDLIIETVKKVPEENLLLLFLGDPLEKLFHPNHKLFEQPLIQNHITKGKKISIVMFSLPVKEPSFEEIVTTDTHTKHNITQILNLNMKFPISPAYGPHVNPYNARYLTKGSNFLKEINKNKNSPKLTRDLRPSIATSLIRDVFSNTVAALRAFVDHKGPVFINSRMTSVCYRSFTFIQNMRLHAGKETEVLVGYTKRDPKYCNTTPLFPDAFTKCNPFQITNENKKKKILKKYYSKHSLQIQNTTLNNNILMKKFKELSEHVNKKANNTLKNMLKGGKRKRYTFKKRRTSSRRL